MPEEDSFEDGQSGGRFIGVMDCNNFFVSCERVFNPSLEGRAVVVLSNNDGCAVSRSAEAKALGIKMGTPAFKIAQEFESKGTDVVMCSSNYTLYADMSRRAMDVLRQLAGRIEIYSIDEAFVDFAGLGKDEVGRLGKEIVSRVRKETGLPVSVGVAHTKTLAKAATRFAKKYPGYGGFCIIDTEQQREKALRLLPAGDVWGIGYRSQKKFAALGISTAYDFVQKGAYWIKQNMGVCGLRTYEELLGKSVIRLDSKALKQTITTSRSFGELVSDLSQLRCAVSNFAASCAQKLRAQHSSAMYATVFLTTSVFREDLPQYYNGATYVFEEAEDSTIGLVSGCLDALDEIYLPGYAYKKAGVTVSGIVPHGHIQQSLYYKSDYERMRKVDCLMDEINRRYGKNRLHLAVQGSSAIFNRRQKGGVVVGDEKWEMRRERLSGCYTTDLRDVILVHCGT